MIGLGVRVWWEKYELLLIASKKKNNNDKYASCTQSQRDETTNSKTAKKRAEYFRVPLAPAETYRLIQNLPYTRRLD